MTKRLQLHDGGWWRFDRYEIKDGYIRPAAGARLHEYDPWDQFRKSKVDSAFQPPYASLFALLTECGLDYDEGGWQFCESQHIRKGTVTIKWLRAGLVFSPEMHRYSVIELTPHDELEEYRQQPLHPDQEQLIADWCSTFGLLGILPHICERVTVRKPSGRRRPSRRAVWWDPVDYSRTGGQWHAHESDWIRLWDEDKPTATITDIQRLDNRPQAETERLTELWGDFFPGIPDRHKLFYSYPLPLTEEFWSIYAEPVPTFLRYALLLHQAIEPLSRDSEFSEVIPKLASVAALNALTAPTGKSTFLSADGTLEHRWICPSLLSIFAEMGVQDLAGGRYVGRCDGCNAPFVSSAYQARYCTQQCAWRHRKRRERDKEKQDGQR